MSVTPYVAPPQTTPWVPLWPLGGQTLGELAYAEITANMTATVVAEASAPTVVAAPAITLDGATPIVIEFSCAAVSIATNPAAIYFSLWDGAVNLGLIGQIINSNTSAALNVPGRFARRLTPAAGTHNYIIKAYSTTSASTIQAGAGGAATTFVPAFVRLSLASPISNAPAGAVLPVQYGTTLPVGPVDGQEAILVNSLTAADFIWRFRYNALATGPNKWEFVGGAPYALPPVGSTAIATTYTTVGAGFTVPRSGDYLITVGGQFGAGTSANAALSVLGGEASKIVSASYVGGGSGAPWLAGTATYSYTAGDALLFRVNSSVAMNLVRGAYTVTPLRVA